MTNSRLSQHAVLNISTNIDFYLQNVQEFLMFAIKILSAVFNKQQLLSFVFFYEKKMFLFWILAVTDLSVT